MNLLKFDYLSFLSALLAAIAVGALLSWFRKVSATYSPVGESSNVGEIHVNRRAIWFTIVLSSVFALAGPLFVIFAPDLKLIGLIVSVIAIFNALTMAKSLSPVNSVSWNEVEIQGPSSVRWQVFGVTRADFSWNDVTGVGTVKGPYNYIENSQGTRIYWSLAYDDFEIFEATLKQKCPSLIWPKNSQA